MRQRSDLLPLRKPEYYCGLTGHDTLMVIKSRQIKDGTIVQTWTRTSVKNDQELSQIAFQSKGIISDETIVSHHPWVDDPEKEMDLLKEQEESSAADISDMFPKEGASGDEGGDA